MDIQQATPLWLTSLRESVAGLRRDYFDPSRVKLTEAPGFYVPSLLNWKVKIVDGGWIRTNLDIDFTSGGNPARYAYVPNDELWVEGAYEGFERTAVLFHELIETNAMIKYGLSYDNAHDLACYFEIGFRRAKATLSESLAQKFLDMSEDFARNTRWKIDT